MAAITAAFGLRVGIRPAIGATATLADCLLLVGIVGVSHRVPGRSWRFVIWAQVANISFALLSFIFPNIEIGPIFLVVCLSWLTEAISMCLLGATVLRTRADGRARIAIAGAATLFLRTIAALAIAGGQPLWDSFGLGDRVPFSLWQITVIVSSVCIGAFFGAVRRGRIVTPQSSR